MSLIWKELSDSSLIASTNNSAELAICWMHGLGAGSYDFKEIIDFIYKKTNINAKWYLPQAPSIPVTINNLAIMPAWYDIYSVTNFDKQDQAGINESSKKIILWCEQQIKTISPKKIVLIGFSQGGAIALYAGLTAPNKIFNILALSTYLPLANSLETKMLNIKANIHFMHGKFDDVITPAIAKASAHKVYSLTNKKPIFEWFDCAHTVCEEELHSICSYLQKLV